MRRRFVLLLALGSAVTVGTLLYLPTLTEPQAAHSSRRSWLRDVKGTLRSGDVTGKGGDDVTGKGDDVTGRRCRAVFPGLLYGRWVAKGNVSRREVAEMDGYLRNTRAEYRIPPSLQRADGRCGDVKYEGVPQYRHMFFRAVCNPQGPTPCCFRFACTNRTRQQCACPGCLDSRTPLHAELSDWLPADPACKAREFSAAEACEVLRGTTLVLAGDSFVRHVFVALVMLLTDNFRDGALKKDAPADTRRLCQGMYQINGLRCRAILDENRSLCSGTVTAVYLEVFKASQGRFLVPHVQSLVTRGQRVVVVAGLGIHDDFAARIVWPMFLKPLVDYFANVSLGAGTFLNSTATSGAAAVRTGRGSSGSGSPATNRTSKSDGGEPDIAANAQGPRTEKEKLGAVPRGDSRGSQQPRPKLIWVSTHAPGLLKSPVFAAQSLEGVRFYNREMAGLLAASGTPILDTFNMTAQLHSVDGTHYGYGANMLKVNVLLAWVREQQELGRWWNGT